MTSARTPAALAALLTAAYAPAAASASPVRHDVLRLDGARQAVPLVAPRPVTAVQGTVAGPRCAGRAARVKVALDGVPLGRVKVPASGRAARFRLPARADAGARTVVLRLTGAAARCRRATVDELRLVLATAAPMPPAAARATHAVPLGAAVPWKVAGGMDTDLDRTVSASFDGITPENDMKMAYVMKGRHQFEWSLTDALMDYAARRGKRVHGHVLVWDQQLPGWLTRRRWSHDELAAVLHDWIHAIAGRYRGRIRTWDVVNELFEDDGSFTRSLWYEVLGEDLVDLAFRYAHEAAPDATLLLTDYDIEAPGPKQDAVVALVQRLKAKGVPIDGIGMQTHWTLGDTDVAEDVLKASYDRFAALGVSLQVTEMDVAIDGGDTTQFGRQADAYARVGRVCHATPACTDVSVWGVRDKDSWRGRHARALLFDDAWAPKPAYAALRDALAGRR